jgi:uncharacterized Zn finger protein
MLQLRGTKVERQWRGLTWAAVEDWAGLRTVDRGREYCRAGRVSRLAVSEGGDVVAWVRGGGRYLCRVRLDEGGIRSRCTCPFPGPGCKHAVAAVLAYLDALRRGREVALVDECDPLWQALDLDDVPAVPALPDDVERLREEIAQVLTWPVPSACESVLPHLRKLRSLLLAAGRGREWDDFEADLRVTHQRRPRLHEVLDRLQTRPIIPAALTA